MTRFKYWARRLGRAHDALLRVWVWLFTVFVLLLVTLIFAELEAGGLLQPEAAETIATMLEPVTIVPFIGLVLLLGVWLLKLSDSGLKRYRERDRS